MSALNVRLMVGVSIAMLLACQGVDEVSESDETEVGSDSITSPAKCTNDKGFKDEKGRRCRYWKTRECDRATEDYGYSKEGEEAVLQHCPKACGRCNSVDPRPTEPEETVGCANGGQACRDGLQCCGGVPYPPEGQCLAECLLDSDVNLKQGLETVDADSILERISQLPVTEWSYKTSPEVRHIGPMAQDFRAAFQLGTDDRHIHPIDANGVTLLAVQALYRRLQQIEAENAELRKQTAALHHRLVQACPQTR